MSKREAGRRSAFLVLFAATCATQIGVGILAPVFPLFARRFSASALSVGLVLGAFSAARAVVSPIIGRVSDRVDRKLVILAGLVGYGAVSWLFLAATSLWHLGALRFLQGLTAAMVAPVAQAYVGDMTPAGHEGRYVNVFYAAMFAGMALGPAIGGVVADAWSYREVFVILGGMSCAAVVVTACMLPSNRRQRPRAPSGTSGCGEKAGRWDAGIGALVVYWFTHGFLQQAFLAFFPVFAVSVRGFSESSIGVVMGSQLLAGGLMQIPFGWLADRYRRLPQVAAGMLLAPIAILGAMTAGHHWVVVPVAFAVGVADALSRASMLAARVELGRSRGMGAMSGLQMGAFGAGQLSGPVVCGLAIDWAGIAALAPLIVGVGVVGAILTFALLRRAEMSATRVPGHGVDSSATIR